jgi:Mg/Co/Ni transporter MgtE
MQEALILALDFLDEHPDVAVRILEQHDARQVAGFLDSVPEAYSVLVIGRVLPAFAAHLCHVFGVEMSARLLLQQDVGRMVAVLRHLEHAVVEAILHECPTARKQACLLLLQYPVRSVGAWIVPDVAVVSSDFTVTETLNFLKDANEATSMKYVFVVNRDGILEGRITHLALLQGQADQRIEWFMEKDLECIPAQLLVTQAAKLPCWQDEDVMPVIGAQQQFVGALCHASLRRALNQDAQVARQPVAGGDPISGIVDAYGQSLLALFNSVSTAVESELKPVPGSKRS